MNTIPNNQQPAQQSGRSNILDEIWLTLFSIKLDVGNAAGKLLGKLKVVFVLLTVAVIAAIVSKNEAIMFYTIIASSLVFLITFFCGKFFARSIQEIAKNIPTKAGEAIGTPIANIAAELEKLFFPLCTTALIIVFIGLMVAIIGFNSMSTQTLIVIVGLATFLSYFGVYQGTKTKWGLVLTPIVFLMVGYYYVKTTEDPLGSTIRTEFGIKKNSVARHNSRNNIRNEVTMSMVVVKEAAAYQFEDSVAKNGAKISVRVKYKNYQKGAAAKVLDQKGYEWDGDGQTYIPVKMLDNQGGVLPDTIYFLYPALAWGDNVYRSGEFLQVKEDDVYYIVALDTNLFSISTKDIRGKITFSSFSSGEWKWNNTAKDRKGIDNEGMNDIPPSCQVNFKDESCVLKAKHPGAFLEIRRS